MQRDPAEMERRLRQFEEYQKRETRFSTQEEFLAFCKEHFCYYPPDFGAWIQTLITNDQEFIDYVQRVCVDDWYEGSGGLSWVLNEAEDNPYVEIDTIEDDDELDDANFEIVSDPVESYKIDYNPYFDQPFAVIKDRPEHQKRLIKPEHIRVRPEIQQKMPFIARFVSHDTFDRMGSIKGNQLDIIQLSELEPGKIMFL